MLRRKINNVWFAVIFLMGPWMTHPCEATSIVNSKHNLSVSGYGTVKATTESEICIFCHAPHNTSAQAPLWNRYDSGQTYIPYTSSTARAAIGQPTGASKLCLSCHDGTVAIGMVRSRPDAIQFEGGITMMPDTRKKIGTDLSDDHPISFPFNSSLSSGNPELVDPSTLTGSAQLDRNGEMQCTSCHDPHDDQNNKFLVANLLQEELCIQCHKKTGWSSALHNITGFAQPNRCLNCHTPHAAGGKQRLLVYAAEEDNCYLGCHSISSTKTNINKEFNTKPSKHPISSTTGIHDPTEPVLMDPAKRHVECQDCHNPHRANDQDTPDLKGSLSGVRGINASGAVVQSIAYEYELCFRCHGDSNRGVARINRQYPETNTRLEFSTTNLSYHPVEGVGKNLNVPSLIAPRTTSSIIKCTDCHNNSTVGGPNGPHGSQNIVLLANFLLMIDNITESASSYSLCYKCHSRTSILSNQSFDYHSFHVVVQKAPCTACHDPHASKNATHLINFDRNIVSPNSSDGVLIFTDMGTFRGWCNLRCHGRNHTQYNSGY